MDFRALVPVVTFLAVAIVAVVFGIGLAIGWML
jgi:uncharacterized membrane protein YciS (DUF1049 family)